MHEHPQLTLRLDTAPATSFDSFHVDEENVMARDAVRAFVNRELDDVQLYLWGSSGTGKSHLLSAACNAYNQQGYRIAYLGLALADLQTRLSWGVAFQLKPLSDQGLREALRKEIEQRSLQASDEVLGFVLRRFPRRMNILKQVVDVLDDVSLMEQRRITVPLVKQVFGEAERAELAGRAR